MVPNGSVSCRGGPICTLLFHDTFQNFGGIFFVGNENFNVERRSTCHVDVAEALIEREMIDGNGTVPYPVNAIKYIERHMVDGVQYPVNPAT